MNVFALLFFIIFYFISVLCIDPLVLTSHGLVQGLRSKDGSYYMFLGIPYAQVNPDNPFSAPLENDPFEGIYKAFDDTAVCPQREDFNYIVDPKLDCLRINLYIPYAASSKNLLPVMIWIHGGDFNYGSSNRHLRDEEVIVRENVILVAFNYRIGIYGFLNLHTPDIPGNAGLRDQLAAFQWIKRNIAAFGGNSNDITLFGESAGAASIEFHMFSGLADGLFHRVIMESGTAFSDWSISEANETIVQRIAMKLGLHTNDKEIAIDYLKRVDTQEVINATATLNLLFRPTIEQPFDGVETIITDVPSNAFRSYKDIPILIGFNSLESLENLLYPKKMDKNLTITKNIIENKLIGYFNFTNEELVRASKLVEDFYIGEGRQTDDAIMEILEFYSDFSIIYPIRRSISYHLKHNMKLIYQYIVYSGQNRNNDNEITQLTTKMWTNFAKYGDPTPDISNVIPIKWESTNKDKRLLLIDNELNMTYHPYHRRMAFWDIFFSLYEDKGKW